MKSEKSKYIYYDLSLFDEYADLTAIDNLIYCRIRGFAEKYGHYNLPLSDLAKCVQSSEDTVRRSIRRIIKLGLLEECKENGKTTTYRPLAKCDPSQNATPRKMRPPIIK